MQEVLAHAFGVHSFTAWLALRRVSYSARADMQQTTGGPNVISLPSTGPCIDSGCVLAQARSGAGHD